MARIVAARARATVAGAGPGIVTTATALVFMLAMSLLDVPPRVAAADASSSAPLLGAPRTFLPQLYEVDPTWRPRVPASAGINVTGVSAVACNANPVRGKGKGKGGGKGSRCTDIFVAQRGGNVSHTVS